MEKLARSESRFVNALFEKRMADIKSLLHTIGGILDAQQIAYELVGGMAVFVYVEGSETGELAAFTRDVDLMIDRSDLRQVIEIAERHGFTYRHAIETDMLIAPGETKATHAVHLIFTGEKTDEKQILLNPPLAPQQMSVEGESVPVIGMEDLIRMKLSSFRLKDQGHLKTFELAGLISPTIESKLPPELRRRLQYIREHD